MSASKYCTSQTIPWLNYGTSSVTILHGWKERDRVSEGEGALFPKFAPQDKDCLIFIHPLVAHWWESLRKSIQYDNEQIVIHLALSPLDSDSYQRERLRQKPSLCMCVCVRGSGCLCVCKCMSVRLLDCFTSPEKWMSLQRQAFWQEPLVMSASESLNIVIPD